MFDPKEITKTSIFVRSVVLLVLPTSLRFCCYSCYANNLFIYFIKAGQYNCKLCNGKKISNIKSNVRI